VQKAEKLQPELPCPSAPAPSAIPHASAAANTPPSATEVYEMIAEAAYYRAEKRGFAPGLEAEDWSAAEAEVMGRMRAFNWRAAP
jgi:DUF2934 family protein